MARAALARRAIDGPCAVMYMAMRGDCLLFAVWRLGRPLMARTDPRYTGPFRRAKNGPSQMRRPVNI